MGSPPLEPITPPRQLWERPTWLLGQVAGRSYQLVLDRLGDVRARSNYAVLSALVEFGPTSQAGLCRRLGIDRSDMVSMLDDLAERGLVHRGRDPNDGRRNLVTITPSGESALAELDDRVVGAQEDLLEPLTEQQRRQFTAILQRLLRHHSPFSPPRTE